MLMVYNDSDIVVSYVRNVAFGLAVCELNCVVGLRERVYIYWAYYNRHGGLQVWSDCCAKAPSKEHRKVTTKPIKGARAWQKVDDPRIKLHISQPIKNKKQNMLEFIVAQHTHTDLRPKNVLPCLIPPKRRQDAYKYFATHSDVNFNH